MGPHRKSDFIVLPSHHTSVLTEKARATLHLIKKLLLLVQERTGHFNGFNCCMHLSYPFGVEAVWTLGTAGMKLHWVSTYPSGECLVTLLTASCSGTSLQAAVMAQVQRSLVTHVGNSDQDQKRSLVLVCPTWLFWALWK